MHPLYWAIHQTLLLYRSPCCYSEQQNSNQRAHYHAYRAYLFLETQYYAKARNRSYHIAASTATIANESYFVLEGCY